MAKQRFLGFRKKWRRDIYFCRRTESCKINVMYRAQQFFCSAGDREELCVEYKMFIKKQSSLAHTIAR